MVYMTHIWVSKCGASYSHNNAARSPASWGAGAKGTARAEQWPIARANNETYMPYVPYTPYITTYTPYMPYICTVSYPYTI
eukprot:4381980-Pyramimonas_sp.AAC.1